MIYTKKRAVAVVGALAAGAVVSLGVIQVADSAEPTANPSQSAAATTRPAVKKPAPVMKIDVNSGPSAWRGRKLWHPDGGEFDAGVLRWANIVAGVMREQHIPRHYLPGILAQIEQESDGDPELVNTYDSNAAAGTPSKGLLQVIGPTFLSHAPTQYRSLKYQTVPYTNIWAALRYVIKNYGMEKFAQWSSGNNSAY